MPDAIAIDRLCSPYRLEGKLKGALGAKFFKAKK